MAHALRGASSIVGVGLAGLGESPGHSHLESFNQAAHAAVADAGMTMRDVDGNADVRASPIPCDRNDRVTGRVTS